MTAPVADTDPATAVACILLAAGASRRMRGRDKLMEEVDGQPLVRRMARRCLRAASTRVVLGPGQSARRAALDGLDIAVVEAADTDGMSASLRAGIGGLGTRGALIVLADMPAITAADLHLMASLWAQGTAPILQAAGADGTPGHPVLFHRRYFPEILRLRGDGGAAPVLRAHPGDVARLPLAGDRARLDLDTPEDWAAWRAAQDS